MWKAGRESLYALCRKSTHADVEATASKLWLIGRSHAAALERMPDRAGGYGKLYWNTARAMDWLDEDLAKLRALRRSYDVPHLLAMARLVERLADTFRARTKLWKISLASKYLHFHDDAIPIYDQLSVLALRRLVPRHEFSELRRELTEDKSTAYRTHLAAYTEARRLLRSQRDCRPLDARHIDNFLIWWAATP